MNMINHKATDFGTPNGLIYTEGLDRTDSAFTSVT